MNMMGLAVPDNHERMVTFMNLMEDVARDPTTYSDPAISPHSHI
jgi:hypothetical protein